MIAKTVDTFLNTSHIHYDLLTHRHTDSSMDTAQAARVPEHRLAKAVVLRDRRDGACVMAVIPASHRLHIGWLEEDLNRDLELVSEQALSDMFPDCEAGAVPPFGPAYHMYTVWDDDLAQQPEVYCEAGDHEHLLRIARNDFRHLFDALPHGIFSVRAEDYSPWARTEH